ncbi:hypothetical protein [Rhodopirellula bahusiensis]|uniref:Uncharacterized protein n=1 Tax=Rhodopirellula bahusiensis TaxID=2014065 RepID=A0A2G1VZ26_9BACT|nr:hypothetical protein [Rhodopirellula bahusiensis]PHQ31860.1 hypothetical protein CEE69_28725 [Rhodopirellula bahusiensis]
MQARLGIARACRIQRQGDTYLKFSGQLKKTHRQPLALHRDISNVESSVEAEIEPAILDRRVRIEQQQVVAMTRQECNSVNNLSIESTIAVTNVTSEAGGFACT